MIVRFKNTHPSGVRINYQVVNPEPVWMFDEILCKFCNCIEIQALGFVAQEILEECEPEGVDAIDVLARLTNNRAI